MFKIWPDQVVRKFRDSYVCSSFGKTQNNHLRLIQSHFHNSLSTEKQQALVQDSFLFLFLKYILIEKSVKLGSEVITQKKVFQTFQA